MDSRIFVSYSTKDSDIAFKIVDFLEQHGYTCWIAPRNIDTGFDYSDVINNAIEHCRAFVLLFSDASEKSQFVKKEVSIAVSFNKHIIPFRISRVELRGGFMFLLNNVQWIDAVSHPDDKFELIVNALERGMGEVHNKSLYLGTSHKRTPIWIAIVVVSIVVAAILWFDGVKDDVDQMAADNLIVIDTIAVADDKSYNESIIETPSSHAQTYHHTEMDTKKNKTILEKTDEKADANENKTVFFQGSTTASDASNVNKTSQSNSLMKKANRYYNAGKYLPALEIYERLKREDPTNKEIDVLIIECQKHLNGNE